MNGAVWRRKGMENITYLCTNISLLKYFSHSVLSAPFSGFLVHERRKVSFQIIQFINWYVYIPELFNRNLCTEIHGFMNHPKRPSAYLFLYLQICKVYQIQGLLGGEPSIWMHFSLVFLYFQPTNCFLLRLVSLSRATFSLPTARLLLYYCIFGGGLYKIWIKNQKQITLYGKLSQLAWIANGRKDCWWWWRRYLLDCW